MRTSLMLAGLAACSLLAACDAEQGEVHAWMQEQRASIKPQVQPIPEPKRFTPQAYTQEAAVDPFSQQKLVVALKRDSQQVGTPSAALLQPELNRRKEPLEAYPLDAMLMVGSLMKQGQPVALLKVDNLLYQVKPGNYLGQNYGRITKVTETEVVLRELVQDAAGEWVERVATLQLQEKSK
ncbi:pilus assembly protein PilP [Ramlibacter alkalitolerans]|jgi:type IV pilus assembly protein PilP|uniref:Pilus assembly protein PilP n=1 Tax=Ramlibacter alkalitolerans TaxID=2039631 RepID=A0ABS1JJD7_9BURK|nr:pilus assembly protein PilP [Ramlibacter alkalitolerans]MBL0423930.1 pilus assembly protein PilP [Ramlibacter alkalitolerans]